MFSEYYFSTGWAQESTIHVKQLSLRSVVWETGVDRWIATFHVRKCSALRTPSPVKPVSQPPSGHQSLGCNAPHPDPGALCPVLEWPTDWKFHLGLGARKDKRYLTTRHTHRSWPYFLLDFRSVEHHWNQEW